MKIGVLICALLLGMSVTAAANGDGAFEPARCVPDATKPTFFIFTTSFGRYTIGNNGYGELGANGKKRLFDLRPKIRLVGRLKQMYFREHQGDLLLLYQVSDGQVYLARMNQDSKLIRWFTLVKQNSPGPCMVQGDEAHCGDGDNVTKIDLTNGKYVT